VTPIELHNNITCVSVTVLFMDGIARSTNAPIQQ
jgi:hypothetical protein